MHPSAWEKVDKLISFLPVSGDSSIYSSEIVQDLIEIDSPLTVYYISLLDFLVSIENFSCKILPEIIGSTFKNIFGVRGSDELALANEPKVKFY